jgi:hypothetical protein
VSVINQRGFDDLTVKPAVAAGNGGGGDPAVVDAVASLDTAGAVLQGVRALQPLTLGFPPSDEQRGFALQSLRLTRGFEGFIGNLFKTRNEVLFLAWGYDLSGEAPWLWPGKDIDVETLRNSLKAGETREFLGAGALLFPARQIYGGIALRIQIWESDSDVRRLGKTIEDVSKAIDDSKLTNVLSLIAAAGGPTTATLALIRDAATELGKIIGAILKGNSNDLVDFYDGYFPVSDPWTAGEETHVAHGSEIVLTRIRDELTDDERSRSGIEVAG